MRRSRPMPDENRSPIVLRTSLVCAYLMVATAGFGLFPESTFQKEFFELFHRTAAICI